MNKIVAPDSIKIRSLNLRDKTHCTSEYDGFITTFEYSLMHGYGAYQAKGSFRMWTKGKHTDHITDSALQKPLKLRG
jgi:membrane-bound inhibitor of C-type lysozyme